MKKIISVLMALALFFLAVIFFTSCQISEKSTESGEKLTENISEQAIHYTIAAGYEHSMAIKSDGSLWAWGGNWWGQLGDGTEGATEYKLTPVKIMDGVTQVSVGANLTLAIKSDGSLWAWGYNWGGRIITDDSTIEESYSPMKIMDGVTQVSTSSDFTMAIKIDGSLWAWGRNEHGGLGDGTKANRYSPVKIMDEITQVSVGDVHTMAIKIDGSLWAWGYNEHGELGDGTMEYMDSPVKIMDGVTQVSAGFGHTMAIKIDGSLWAWGRNEHGGLGDGTRENRYSPVKIMDGVVQVSAGGDYAAGFTMAIKNDGSLWAWGYNRDGELGDGTTEHSYSPVKIMDGVVQVSAGARHTIAIKSDGSLWAWGYSVRGQIGDGTLVRYDDWKINLNRLTPVKIMD